jgi:hypothetical protein
MVLKRLWTLPDVLSSLSDLLEQSNIQESLEARVLDFWMKIGLSENDIYTAHSPNGSLFGKEVTHWNRENNLSTTTQPHRPTVPFSQMNHHTFLEELCCAILQVSAMVTSTDTNPLLITHF